MGSSFPSSFPEDILGLFCLYLPNASLKQCCLTSRNFRYFSRPLLWESVTIRNNPGEREPRADVLKFWEEALREDAELGTLVKSLTLLHTDEGRSNHWLSSFTISPVLSYIMLRLPNLVTLAITRLSPPPWGSEIHWKVKGWFELTSTVQHVLNLPTLKNFYFYERYKFRNPDDLRQLIRLTKRSGIRSLHLCGSKFLDGDDPSSALVPALYKAKIENLRLYYLHQNITGGLWLISSLISPASSFDVTNLSSLELWAVGVEDETWIPAILGAQRSDSALQHLGLFAVEGYPKKEFFVQSLSRFTSIRKFSISEADRPIFSYEILQVEGIVFGFAAAWISALPKNIASSVEEVNIHIEARQWALGLQGVDALLSSDAMNVMPQVKKIKLHVKDAGGEGDAERFLLDEWRLHKKHQVSSDPDQATLRKWAMSMILPKTYPGGKVELYY
ncbi:hypothetical protein DL96DRAFT_1581443 [Flagelloscypha sp. PMI_526]|nr:hypothetical protein DL96DRAFT_1581443 [Flagelloscypha sp. PMI_526]